MKPNTEKKNFEIPTCINCGNPVQYFGQKYCGHICQQEYQYKDYISKWKAGLVSGMTGDLIKELSNYVARYLKEKYNSKCARCGWHEVNPFTNNIPLEIEHIDGNYLHNTEDNLILLCPNCHSLTATYKGANKGNGRKFRNTLS